MSAPKYDLTDVFKLVEGCTFTVPNKSVFAVMAVKKLQGASLSTNEAAAWIRKKLLTLTLDDHCSRQVLWDDVNCIADVYAKEIENENWYIKFFINDDSELEEISFHPTAHEIRQSSGNIIGQGKMVYDEEKKMWRVRE